MTLKVSVLCDGLGCKAIKKVSFEHDLPNIDSSIPEGWIRDDENYADYCPSCVKKSKIQAF